jgi:hypothetical protein
MTSTYSNSSAGKPVAPKFKKHQTREVVTSLAESKQIANDYSDAKRWVHRAKVSVMGNVSVKLYQPIYLDGLPNGMSGYWTVLSIRHTFGGIPAKYLLELEVGTDVIGEIDLKAKKANTVRDVQAEISGQSVTADPAPQLLDLSLSPNSSDLSADYGLTSPTAVNQPPAVGVPAGLSNNIYSTKAPNFKVIKRTTTWKSTSPKGVQNVGL